jgi:hypothetical protein
MGRKQAKRRCQPVRLLTWRELEDEDEDDLASLLFTPHQHLTSELANSSSNQSTVNWCTTGNDSTMFSASRA